MFNKKKISKKTANKVYVNIIGLFMIFVIFFMAIFVFSFIEDIGNYNNTKIVKINTSSGTLTVEKEKQTLFTPIFDFFSLEKKTQIKDLEEKPLEEAKNKINVLVVGRGGGLHDAPNLTDSIIILSLNKSYKTISMLSIPRDLYIEYPWGKAGKINELYALASLRYGSNSKGMEALESVIYRITGEEIDYYVNIDFKGFTSFVDSIGGLEITVPETLYDEQYPDGNWGYRTLIIKKGTWLFDGETALMYARSRHSTSDFDRSLRQQQILKALKNKLTEGGVFSKLSNLKNFFDVFIKYIKTDISIVETIRIFNDIKDLNSYKILSFNLNDSCFFGDPECKKGGFLYLPNRELFGGASVLLPNGASDFDLSNYSEISSYMDMLFNNADIYLENIQINVFNSTRHAGFAGDVATDLIKYGFNIPIRDSIGNARDKNYEKSVILYSPTIENTKTLLYLKEKLSIDTIKRDSFDPVYGKDENTLIEIIIGDDYEELFKKLNDNF